MDAVQPQYGMHSAGPGPGVATVALTLLTMLTASLPAVAQPFTRTIANGETVVVPRTQSYGLPANESLLIESGGELQGRGSIIGLAGRVENKGQLRSYIGSENAVGVGVTGQFTNSPTGRIEVTSLYVGDRGAFTSSGSLLVGGFRINPSDPLVTVCASTTPCPGTGFEIDTGGFISVKANSGLLNHGDAQVSGILEIEGSFLSRNSTNPSGGGPYAQTLTVGKDPIYGYGQGVILISGSFELQRGNTLRNFSSVINRGSGTLTLAGGRLEQMATGRLDNLGLLVVGSGGELTLSENGSFDSTAFPPKRLANFFSTGSITVQNNGTLHNGWMTQVEDLGLTAARLSVEEGGTLTQGDAALLAITGGRMLVRGSVTGGQIELHNKGNTVGSLNIMKGGTVDIQSYRQSDGVLTVNGTLTGDVTLSGGDLAGGGLGSRINGKVLVAGAGGGPPQEPPNCGNASTLASGPATARGIWTSLAHWRWVKTACWNWKWSATRPACCTGIRYPPRR